MLAAYAAGDLAATEMEKVAGHLRQCLPCRTENDALRNLASGTVKLNDQCDRIMAGMDWERSVDRIMALIPADKEENRTPAVPRGGVFAVSWRPAAAAAALLSVGILLGYLLFHRPATRPPLIEKPGDLNTASLEIALARREIGNYFQGTQLVLTDLLKECAPAGQGGQSDWQNVRIKARARELLQKGHYVSQNLDDPRLVSVKNLLQQTELLFYEILALDDRSSCAELKRLQTLIEQERLLLKIRLVEKDLASKEV